jgi:hypothetical protein
MTTTVSGDRRSRARSWRRAASLLILLPSLSTLVYAGFLPVPLGPQMVAGVLGFGVNSLTLLGLAGLVAAIGVWRGRRWGRILGAVVTVLLIALSAWWPFVRFDAPAEPLAMASAWLTAMVLPVAAGGCILYVLWLRWEAPAA